MQRFRTRWLPIVLLMAACNSTPPNVEPVPNQPPIVWLAAGPPEGSVGTYTVRLYWGGWDPDGEVSHYEYLIADNVTGVFDPADTTYSTWSPVFSTDSTFVFSADSLTEAIDGHYVSTRSHTFFVRAVDNEMLPSKEPAHRSFTSRTISPEVRITAPAISLVPPIATFRWVATDYVDDVAITQDPDSVQWALVNMKQHGDSYAATIAYLQDPKLSAHEWYPWVWYRAPQDAGKSWTTPTLELGHYVFAIRAKDEADAVTPVLLDPVNVRRIMVTSGPNGPTLIAQNPLVGKLVASSCESPVTVADIPANIPLAFALTACFDRPGGTVVAYRYGWDIVDPDDPEQWEIDYTPFVGLVATTPPRAFGFGTHTFTAEVIDDSETCSRVHLKLNMVRFSGERNLLVVDDYRPDETPESGWTATNGAMPSDAEHDAFWLDMVSNVDQFDPNRDMLSTQDGEISLTTIALYKNMVWSVFGEVLTANPSDLPLLYTYIRYRSTRVMPTPGGRACSQTPSPGGPAQTDPVALAMQAGVHVIIAGRHPIQNVVPRAAGFRMTWPMIPLYELERDDAQCGEPRPLYLSDPPGVEGFAYKELCIEAIDFAYLRPTTARMRVGPDGCRRYCATEAWRDPLGSLIDDTMRGATPADPNFAPITLRAEAAAPGRAFAPDVQGINAEIYNPGYFREGAACGYVPPPRACFEPIYLMDCLGTGEPTYLQPVAFWTSTFADVIAEDIPGAVAARSAVFGFPPVYFKPGEIKPALQYIFFDEWQLPRQP